jgi:pimeloyl-ACP methyl ester carboxylesterase
MEPRIQYAQTADGVSIAFWTLGEGMPWLQTPAASCGVLQVEWQVPEFRAWYERLARKRMLVQYDCRGTGLSERGVADYSLDAMVRDLEAVAGCLELPSFALWGSVNFGPVAIAYAARHPERVSQLMLWCTYARGSDFFTPQAETMTALVEKDWRLYTEALCHYFLGLSTGETTGRLAALIRKSVTPEKWYAAYGSAAKFEVEALLPEVKAPTLVLHRRQLPWLSVDVATDLASRIPGAQLAVLEGASGGTPWRTGRPCLPPSTTSWARVRRPQRRPPRLASSPSSSRTWRAPPPSSSAWATPEPRRYCGRTTPSSATH